MKILQSSGKNDFMKILKVLMKFLEKLPEIFRKLFVSIKEILRNIWINFV